MDHPQVSRVIIDSEPAWLRVKGNLSTGIAQAMEARLNGLPGGSQSVAARALRKEVEGRISKVSHPVFLRNIPDINRYGRRCSN
jgi:hypothetical protein